MSRGIFSTTAAAISLISRMCLLLLLLHLFNKGIQFIRMPSHGRPQWKRRRTCQVQNQHDTWLCRRIIKGPMNFGIVKDNRYSYLMWYDTTIDPGTTELWIILIIIRNIRWESEADYEEGFHDQILIHYVQNKRRIPNERKMQYINRSNGPKGGTQKVKSTRP